MNAIKAKFLVLETVYGCVDAEMDDDQYAHEHLYADHFSTLEEAQQYAMERNLTHSAGGRYHYRATVKA